MPSIAHEELIDDVRFGFSEFRKTHPENEKMGYIAEQIFFNILFPSMKGCKLVADGWLVLDDGYCPIALEVGRMDDGKWRQIFDPRDGKAIRVLRIGFDRTVSILNPRNTELEVSMLSFYGELLGREEI